ncbi:MAG: prephenate dehydrogenase/arogenate dehydrogenase family protein, partial [Bacteroidetes bacterium]|nr:prephenate dehydrogenase/arogenate dehydrogenase family protein [Bacteroidota bacterium]
MNDRKFQMENIAIIGLGLIGGSIAKALRKSPIKLKIAAF